MKTVQLHGALAAEFGSSFRLDVRSPAEAIRLLEANFPGRFVKAIRNKWFRVARRANGPCLAECELSMDTVSNEIHLEPAPEEYHVEPVVQGGFKAFFGLFFGPGLLSSVFTPLGLPLVGGAGVGGALGGFGSILIGITIIGVIALISGALTPKEKEQENPDERTSFLFQGAVNQSEQGGPVPLIYGEFLVGSTVISGGIAVEEQT